MLRKLHTIALVIALLAVAIVTIYAQPWKASHAAPPKKATPTPHGITVGMFSPNVPLNYKNITTTDVISKNDIWQAGSYLTDADLATKYFTAHYDGTNWALFSEPDFGFTGSINSIYAVSPYDVYAVGSTTHDVNSDPVPFLEHFDGDTWSIMALPPVPSGTLFSVLGFNSHDIYAVGNTYGLHQEEKNAIIFHYDGSNWTQIVDPSGAIRITSLQILSRSPNTMIAVASYKGYFHRTSYLTDMFYTINHH